mgnify:CR=1 FL=1
MLCATCHAPFRRFQDARARAFGLELVDRNTLTVVNARFYRWYGWDGAHDSLWSQSLRPLLDPREMSASPAHIAAVIRKLFSNDYERAFGGGIPTEDEDVLVEVGSGFGGKHRRLALAS